MKKVTYIISDIDKALAFEWVAMHITKEKFNLDFILLNKGDSQLESFLKRNQFQVRRVKLYHGWKMIFTFFPLWLILLRSRPDIIHAHLRYASLLGITAGYFSGIKTRIHTRHHASSNHDYYPHAVKQDKWVSKLSTHIVSISDVVTEVLVYWEKTNLDKVVKIPHGFDLSLFQNPDPQSISFLKSKYNPQNKGPVIGMISRYLELKGINYCIDAFKQIQARHPDAFLILANATGSDHLMIESKLNELPDDTYMEIKFEPDISSLYHLFDIFVHIPITKHSEAFGQTYIEALAAGIPSVFTLSGIANEFIVDNYNALVVPYKDAVSIKEKIIELLENPDLMKRLALNGKKDIVRFNLPDFIGNLESLYGIK